MMMITSTFLLLPSLVPDVLVHHDGGGDDAAEADDHHHHFAAAAAAAAASICFVCCSEPELQRGYCEYPLHTVHLFCHQTPELIIYLIITQMCIAIRSNVRSKKKKYIGRVKCCSN